MEAQKTFFLVFCFSCQGLQSRNEVAGMLFACNLKLSISVFRSIWMENLIKINPKLVRILTPLAILISHSFDWMFKLGKSHKSRNFIWNSALINSSVIRPLPPPRSEHWKSQDLNAKITKWRCFWRPAGILLDVKLSYRKRICIKFVFLALLLAFLFLHNSGVEWIGRWRWFAFFFGFSASRCLYHGKSFRREMWQPRIF